MLKQIEYKQGTSGKCFYVCDDRKLTKSEAQLFAKSEGCSDLSFTLTKEQFNVIREHLTQVGVRTKNDR